VVEFIILVATHMLKKPYFLNGIRETEKLKMTENALLPKERERERREEKRK
jgi:hypothetical protein